MLVKLKRLRYKCVLVMSMEPVEVLRKMSVFLVSRTKKEGDG